MAVNGKIKPPEYCAKRADPGTCAAVYPAWYFDYKRGVCKLFFFSGCGGNRNRFNTEVECQGTCLPSKTPASLCSLLPKPVPCKSLLSLWTFDPRKNTCQHFGRGYCGGNANKFASCVKCMSRCSIIHAEEACRLIHEKMKEMKKHPPRRPE
ncbi:BPTI/Kunitz domain-containing protein-like isoform X2 [Dermacentor silvarum]|uniref:BPTI/Kunitz domain-containing protein-like isoform X2 n=1 Tax=Dermacentor silvarum TaxID=543639 RepID=UPI002100BA93|nr:BPTI/Kunitz domain-containing protein-like isoform X2 [Dermacentor silvarum]